MKKLVTDIYVLDRNKQKIDVLSNNGTNPNSPFFNDIFKSYLETGAESFEFSTIVNERTNCLQNGNFVCFVFKNKQKLFQIMNTTSEHTDGILIKTCYCETVGLELLNKVVRKSTLNGDVKTFFNLILQDSTFELGYVDPTITEFKTIQIDKPTPIYTVIQDNLETYNIEIEFTVKFKKSKVYKQYINVYRQRGEVTHARFEYSTNVDNVKKNEDLSDFCSALIGYGQNGIDFKNVEWLKSNGNPVDKPLNQDFVVDEKAHMYFHNDDGSYITGVFESNADNPADLLNETWKKLQEIKEPKIDYETNISLLSEDVNIGDTVYVIDHEYEPDLYLEARVSELELSFTDWFNKSKCKLANYKEVKSKIKNLSTNDDIIKDVIDFLGGIGVGKLTDEDIAKIKEFMEKMGMEKDEIDKFFNDIEDIINPKPDPPSDDDEDNEAVYLTSIKNGIWLGDDRLSDVKKSKTVAVVDEDEEYVKALKLYEKYNIGKNQNSTELSAIISSSNKYKISTIVKHYAKKFGLDPYLVYATIMGESRGDPYCATKDNTGGYGLMQCERGAYFKGYPNTKSQTIKYLDGSTYNFYPSYDNMTPGKGGTATINGITVDRNILNQIRFGCWELRYALDYCHNNIFAALTMFNMGVGSLNWIISRYICDKYGYTFVDSYNLSKQATEVRVKFYEELDSLQFNFATYRKVFKDEKGLGTANNVELYLQWYKIVDGQLPYVLDAKGNKLGYGVNSTPKAAAQMSSNDVRKIIVDTAKAIVQQHTDKLATYDQSYRTVNFQKPNRHPGTFYGIKNPICYDCSSLVSCAYLEAGLKSVYNAGCYAGTLVAGATKKSGYVMFKITKTTIENMKAGDIIMMCNKECPENITRAKAIAEGYTHHTLIYCGKEDGVHMVSHARKWDYWPNAIRYMPVYSDIYKYGFCLRPWDLIEADNNALEETPSVDDTDLNEVYIKALRKANAYDFYDINHNLVTNVEGYYENDNKSYPTTAPYILLHFGINDLTQEGIDGVKILISILKARYRNTPIFILKELHVGTVYTNYETVNTNIDSYNTEIETFCNNEENVFFLDISSSVETYTSVLNPDYTEDGFRFKDEVSIQIYYDAIVNKLLTTPIRYKQKEDTTETEETPSTVKEVVSIVMKANQKYEYDVVNELKFLLPKDVVDSYYSRLIFKTPKNDEPIKYTQSKVVYLEGTDCVRGQLLPKADTKYNVIIMKNTNTALSNEKYYGSVSGICEGGTYKEFKGFVGGKQVTKTAKTYLNRPGLRYGDNSYVVKSEPTSFTNPAANLDKWYDSTEDKANIDCSSLAIYSYMGITFEKSPYANHTMTSVKCNSNYSWTFKLPRTAAEQASYCVSKGWIFNEADLETFSNLEAGDLLFYDRDGQDNGRFMNISHVAICIGEVDGVMMLIESTTCENAVRIKSVESNTADKLLFVARPRKE